MSCIRTGSAALRKCK